MLTNTIFADRMNYMRASEIRELLKITEQPDIISFAGGLPAPELFPLKELSELSSELIMTQGQKALQYSTTEGYTPLRQKISQRMHNIEKVKIPVEELLITSGSQQALDFLGKALIDKGDEIFMESPSYLGAINAFRAYEPAFVEIETDSEGMLPDSLEQALTKSKRPKFIYIVPNFQNPSGRTWSLSRRKAIFEIAKSFGVIIVEDNPYGELRFEGQPIPSVKSLDDCGIVVYLGTFSKTLCPGMRIGWVAASRLIMEKFVLVKQGADLHTSTISQMQINLFMEKYNLDDHINVIKEEYRKRRNAIVSAMEQFFDNDIVFTRPDGGLFSWAELPSDIDSRKLLEKAIQKKVAFVPGGSFFPCVPKHNTMRLNFSNMPVGRIADGIERLSKIMK